LRDVHTGLGESKILSVLAEKDPECKYNTIQVITQFFEHEHLCLVFPAMNMNLRQLVKKRALSMSSVRVIAFRILRALYHLKRCNVIHADLKLDNILISENLSDLKVADLGSAFLSTDPIVETPLLVARYCRSPEIILGLPYGHPIDMFSFGCGLYELSTREPLFRSKDNNDHLFMIMDIFGMLPKKMLALGQFTSEHFDENSRFLERKWDPIINKVCYVRKGNVGYTSGKFYSTVVISMICVTFVVFHDVHEGNFSFETLLSSWTV